MTQEIVGKSHGELSSSDRAGQPAKEEEKRVLKSHDRTGQPVEGRLHKVQEDGYLKNRDDADKFNFAMDDENIDFNISGVPDAMVKRSQSISVHDLIQKIESHPQKEAIQNDLEKHRAFNPFSKKSKDAIMAAGNTELCEIINVEPKLQCKACLKHWSAGIVYCTCGHLMTNDTTENEKYISAVLDLFRTATSGRAGHTVTGMGKHLDAKSTIRRINLQGNAAKRSMTASTTDSSATRPSGRR